MNNLRSHPPRRGRIGRAHVAATPSHDRRLAEREKVRLDHRHAAEEAWAGLRRTLRDDGRPWGEWQAARAKLGVALEANE